MQFEELRFVCQEAARDLVDQHGLPVPPAIVVPGPEKTRIVRLADFPEDDEARHALLSKFAEDELAKNLVPCWGFIAEATVGDQDMIVTVYGARRHAPAISAAPVQDDKTLGDFLEDEQLDPTAMPFLHPLQHTVDEMASLAEAPTPMDAAMKRPIDPPGGETILGGNLPMVD